MERDPAYTPPGPYRFQSGDIEGADVREGPEILARYAAAAAVFEDLTHRVGEDAVRNWLHSVWARRWMLKP